MIGRVDGFWTHWVPRPRFAVMHGAKHASIEAARTEARATLTASPEVDHVEITDGYSGVYETVRRELGS